MGRSPYAPRGLPRSPCKRPPGPPLSERDGPYSLAAGDRLKVGERQRKAVPKACPGCGAERRTELGRMRPGDWIWRLEHGFRWYACGTVVDEGSKVLKRAWRCRLRAFLTWI